MNAPPADVLSLLAKAAELRAGGTSWETIAADVGRAVETVRHWPLRYPGEWDRYFRAAEERLAGEAGGEALQFLRKFLRDKDSRLAQDTAKFLFAKRRDTCARLPAAPADAPPGDWAPFVAYLETLSDADVKTYLEDYLARRLAQAGPAVPEGGDPPSPDQPG